MEKNKMIEVIVDSIVGLLSLIFSCLMLAGVLPMKGTLGMVAAILLLGFGIYYLYRSYIIYKDGKNTKKED